MIYLHVETPGGHTWHAVHDADHLVEVIGRLAPVTPIDSTWDCTTTTEPEESA